MKKNNNITFTFFSLRVPTDRPTDRPTDQWEFKKFVLQRKLEVIGMIMYVIFSQNVRNRYFNVTLLSTYYRSK